MHRGNQSFDGDSKLLLSVNEAARTLSICPRTLWGISAPQGTIPVVRIGNRCFYSPEAMRQWIMKQSGGNNGRRSDE